MTVEYFNPKKNIKHFNENSNRAIYIEMYFNDQFISSGTAFCCESNKGAVLITNRHNFTGRNQETSELLSKTGAIPNRIKLKVRASVLVGKHRIINTQDTLTIEINLYEHIETFDNPLWFEHPLLEEKIDVVGLILPKFDEWSPSFVHIDLDWYSWQVAEKLSVVGFPFGKSVNGFAIWATGYIASDPEIDYEGLPVFLIDCRTRSGQSGSPVISEFRKGEMVYYEEKHFFPLITQTYFLGVYSGRININSDIGVVWKAETVREIIAYINDLE